MAIRIIAQRRVLKIGKTPGAKKFVMRPELYTSLTEKKVFSEAANHSGISAGVIKAAWDAAGEVIRTWATEGHSVPLPGLGHMRFGVRSKAVESLDDVKSSLISTRRIEEYRHPNHLSRRERQRAEARDQRRQRRGGRS